METSGITSGAVLSSAGKFIIDINNNSNNYYN
jgi:hypothetical protein